MTTRTLNCEAIDGSRALGSFLRNALAACIVLTAIVSSGADVKPVQTASTPPAESASAVTQGQIFQRAPWNDPTFFPIAVWLQSPDNAERYRGAGINTYVGLWKGPTESQLEKLKAAGMKLICHQNQVGLKHAEDSTVLAWMHGDEPDNAQSLGSGKGYGPPILPQKIVEDYEAIRAADPFRPILLNLGQGVAWDGWYGRGVRSRHPEDYPEYIKGADIVSFDIYPAVHDHPDVAGKLWLVGYGVERLNQWAAGRKRVWNCLECTRIGNINRTPTPAEVRCEAWMSLIHGSQGLIYFVHQFEPQFNEAALLGDPDMLEAVTALNQQITSLAPVLNSPTITNAVSIHVEDENVPVATMTKAHKNGLYVFAVAMRPGKTRATFKLQPSLKVATDIEVLGENRTLQSVDGSFSDLFDPWSVHLYRLPRSD